VDAAVWCDTAAAVRGVVPTGSDGEDDEPRKDEPRTDDDRAADDEDAEVEDDDDTGSAS
jgi:hypothetical protein